jgi:hypothetical protein
MITVWVRDNRVSTLNWLSNLQLPSILKVSFILTTEFGKVVLHYIIQNTTVQCYWHYQNSEGHFVQVLTGELYIYRIFTHVYKFCIKQLQWKLNESMFKNVTLSSSIMQTIWFTAFTLIINLINSWTHQGSFCLWTSNFTHKVARWNKGFPYSL